MPVDKSATCMDNFIHSGFEWVMVNTPCSIIVGAHYPLRACGFNIVDMEEIIYT